ncbi:hypothetical protein [Okibacterium endophyticum]
MLLEIERMLGRQPDVRSRASCSITESAELTEALVAQQNTSKHPGLDGLEHPFGSTTGISTLRHGPGGPAQGTAGSITG